MAGAWAGSSSLMHASAIHELDTCHQISAVEAEAMRVRNLTFGIRWDATESNAAIAHFKHACKVAQRSLHHPCDHTVPWDPTL